jgi:hypothetical protein
MQKNIVHVIQGVMIAVAVQILTFAIIILFMAFIVTHAKTNVILQPI